MVFCFYRDGLLFFIVDAKLPTEEKSRHEHKVHAVQKQQHHGLYYLGYVSEILVRSLSIFQALVCENNFDCQ